MLIMILAAATAIAAPQQNAEKACPAGIVLVSKTVGPEREPHEAHRIPSDKSDAKGPAVLTPGCKPEQRKKKDYPMA